MVQQTENTSQSTRVMKESVFRRRDRFVFYVLTVLSVLTTIAFLLAWFRLDSWRDYPVMLSVLSVIVLLILGNAQGRWLLLPHMRKPRPLEARPGWKVGVVTTIVPDIEPLFLLENTLEALVALDYSHETWVLDEGDDERVKELCLKRGAFHFSRKYRPQYQTEHGPFRKATKYGNYNAWLQEIGFERYEIISAFDPDHVPERTFLSKVLGYFEDPTVGYVQAPQVYANQDASVIARGAAEESHAFYSSIQMASYGLGYPIIVGCHNSHRVSALREVGGFAPHDADDLLITLFYRNRGWEGVYVPEVLARGLAPSEWQTYLNQQRRWARSILDIKFKIAPSLTGNLSFSSRLMNILHGFSYLHESFTLSMAILLIAVMLVVGEMPKVLTTETVMTGGLLLFIFQICDRYRQRFYLDRKREGGLDWRAALLQFAKWPYLIAAFFDVMFGRRFPYVITSKIPGTPRASLALWPHILTLILIGLAWVIGLSMHETVPVEVQFSAGIVVMAILALLATEWFGAPRSPLKP
jgi:cellulose synthase/poly-beta-1,6-N-acetylglucosamine synthase-like glycosyltransferase